MISFFTRGTVSVLLLSLAAAAGLQAQAPAISATKTDNLPAGTKVNPGATVTYTNTVTNSGAGNATGVNFADPDVNGATVQMSTLKVSPLAFDDVYTGIIASGVSIDTSVGTQFSATTNDYVGVFNNAAGVLSIVSFDATSSNGGAVSMTTSGANVGKFTYTSAAGFTGADTFNYTVSNTGFTSTGTVRLTVSGPGMWFVSPSGNDTTGKGTLAAPFQTLPRVAFLDANTSQRVFMFTGAYTAGMALEANEQILGQGLVGASFDAAVLGIAPGSDSAPRPSINGTRPTITAAGGNVINLADSNTIRGVTINSTVSGFAVAGSATPSLQLGSTVAGTPAADTVVNSTGSSTGCLSLTGSATGTVTVTAQLTATVGRSVNITGRTGGTTSIIGKVTDNGTGISLAGNTGATFNFRCLVLNTGANVAFAATGSSTLNITNGFSDSIDNDGDGTTDEADEANTCATTTGTAVNLNGVTLGAGGLTFRSINSNGAANGIKLVNVACGSPGLSVVGDDTGFANGSGGSIANTTGASLGDAPVYALTCSGTISLKSMNMSLNTNCYSGMLVDNNAGGTLAANVTGCTFIGVTSSVVQNKSLLQFEAGGSANVTANVQNSYFSSNRTYGCFATGAGTSVMNVTVNQCGFGTNVNTGAPVNQPGTTITNPPPFSLAVTNGSSAQVDYTITNNTFWGADGSLGAIYAVAISGASTTGSSRLNGSFNFNKIGKTGVTGSGAANGAGALGLLPGTQGAFRATVIGNDIRQVNSVGINFFNSAGPGANSSATLKVKGNTIAEPDTTGSPLFMRAIVVTPGNSGGANNPWIAEIGDTTGSAPANRNIISDGGTAPSGPNTWQTGNYIRVTNNNNTSALTLPGLLPVSGATAAQVNAFVQGANTLPASSINTTLGAAGINGGSALPLLFAPRAVETSDSATPPDSVSSAIAWTEAARERQLKEPTLPQMASAAEAPAPLTQEQLDTLINASRERWVATGLSNEQLAALDKVSFELADLPGWHLGEAAGKSLRIDRDAGGNGWFIDATPMEDGEFAAEGSRLLSASATSSSSNRVDLLTTILHEMGHGIGLCDTYSNLQRNSVMYGFLSTGERRLPAKGQAIGAQPHEGSGSHFLTGTINIGVLPPGKSVTITYDVIVNNPVTTLPLSSQATVSGGNFTNVLSDDRGQPLIVAPPTPAETNLPGAADPTVTLIERPDASVVSLTRQSADPNRNPGVTWQIVFSQPIHNLSESNFAVTSTGVVGPLTIYPPTELSGPPSTTWNLSVDTGTGSGTLGLNFINDTGLSHDVTTPLPFTGDVYTIDKTPPVFTSLARQTPGAQNTNADSLIFRATFNESVLNVDAADFTVSGTTATITGISGTGPYDITVSGGNLASLDGTVGLDLAGGQNITDTAGNALPGTAPATNETYTVDNTGPTVALSSATGNPAPNAAIPVTVTFNESVTGFDLTDLTVSGGTKGNFAGTGAIYTFDLTPSGPGVIVTADIASSAAQDAALNDSSAATQFTRTVNPTLTASVAVISSAATTITLNGQGFSTTPANNTVVLSSGTATVTAATATQLTCTVTGPLALGALNATVTVAGIGSAGPTQVATVFAPLALPVINVGAGGDYPSLTNAGGLFEALNNFGTSVNITVNITSDLAGELGTNALNELAGGFTVLIRPSGAPRSILGTNAGALIRLNGADRVTFDGSTTGATATGVGGNAALREMTIQNTNVGTSAGVISFGSGTNGAQNNTIRNVTVLGQDPTTSLFGISLGGNTPGTAGTDNDNNRVENCSVKRVIFGIYSTGASAANPNTGTVITMNETSAVATDRIRRVGILVFNDDGVQITANSINGISTNESADAIGIALGNQGIDATITTAGGITNALVSRNRINGIASLSTSGFSAAGITVAGTAGGANTIVNNMITGVTAPATTPDIVAGVYVVGATGSITRLYHNSIAMTGDRGAVASQMPSFGVAITGVDPTVELKNNIIYTTQTASGGGVNAKSYAIGMVTTTFVNLDSNYNAFFSTGANDGGFRTGSLTTAAGTDYATLALWSAAVSDDSNSQEVDPAFVDPLNNLHLNLSTTPLLGDGIAGFATVDFDNEARSISTPTTGADEVGTVISIAADQVSATEGTGAGTTAFTFTVSRVGSTAGAASVDYVVTGSGANPAIAADFGGSFPSGTVIIPDTMPSAQFTINVTQDSASETNEEFTVTLSNPPATYVIATAATTATSTINNDDTLSVTINQAVAQADPSGAGSAINFTAVFSEPVTGFSDAADVTLSGTAGATVAVITGGPTTYNIAADGMAASQGTVIASIPAAVALSAGGAANAASSSTDNTVTFDSVAPVLATAITFNDTALKIGDTSTVTFRFTEAITGFTEADVTVANGTLSTPSSSNGGITWTATLTPNTGVTIATNMLTLDNTGYIDAAGNAGVGTSNSPNYAVDTVRPTVASIVMADSALTVGENSLVTITFSEAVTGFNTADLSVPNGSIPSVSSSDGGITFTGTYTPNAGVIAATNVITVDKTGITDLSGNAGIGTTDSLNFTISTLDVTITATSATAVEGGATGLYTFTRNNSTGDLTVNFQLDASSTARAGPAGADFILNSSQTFSLNTVTGAGTIVIPDGSLTATLSLNALEETPNPAEAAETARLNVVAASGYVVGASPNATVTITENSFLVTTTANSGTGSLRQAVLNADSIAGTDTITFSDGTGGSVNFTDATADTITLSGGQITFGSNVTIAGPGADLLIIQNTAALSSTSRVFNVPSGVTARLSGLTITGGNCSGPGAGLLISGGGSPPNVTVIACAITGNATTASGGGIYQSIGTLSVINSTISGNTAGGSSGGGGIDNFGTALNLINTTISGNSVTINGANNGGAMLSQGGTTTIRGCTITGNSSVGGASGVRAFGSVNVANSIIAGNVNNTTLPDVVGTAYTSGGGNLIGNAGTATGFTNGTNSDQVGTGAAPINPQLASLANNGGRTQTHALLAASTALNAGINAQIPVDTFDLDGDLNTTEVIDVDQRGTGFTRAIGTVDVGAFELQKSVSIVATSANKAEGTGFNPLGSVFNFSITRTGTTSGPVTMTYTVAGSGTNPASSTDFTGNPSLPDTRTITIPDTASSATQAVLVAWDTLVEPDETFTVTLSAPDNGYVVTGSPATGTIVNDDTAAVSIAKITDGVEAAVPTAGKFRVTQTAASSTDTTVAYTVTGTASSGTDYTALSGSVTILAGSTTADIDVTVLNDGTVLEPTETVIATLTGVTAGSSSITLGTTVAATMNLTDDDTATVTITKITDGNETGPVSALFRVTQTAQATVDTVITYSTGGTAGVTDFTSPSGSVTILAGNTTADITVAITNDLLVEATETLSLTLTGLIASDADVSLGTTVLATASITDNDLATVTIAKVTDAGEPATNGLFRVTQSALSSTDTTVTYAVTTGAAAAGSDFTALSGSVTILAGNTTADITLSVVNDAVVETTETVTATLNGFTARDADISLGATVAATVSITDEDTATITLAKITDGAEAAVSTNALFRVTQSAAASTDTVVSYSVGGTATSGSDFTALSGFTTIPAGSTTADITVTVLNDNVVEAIETVSLTLTEVSIADPQINLGATLTASANITDNDTATVTLAKITDGAETGPTSAVFRVTQTAQATVDTVITYTAGGTASGTDFTAPSGSVTIPAGLTTADISVTISNDTLVEATETLSLTLTGFTARDPDVSLGSTVLATADITDNDFATVSVTKLADGAESNTPTAGSFRISQSALSSVDTVVNLSITGSATSGADFTALPASVTIPANQSSVDVPVTVLNDNIIESTETVTMTLDSLGVHNPGITIVGGGAGSALPPGVEALIPISSNTATLNITDNDVAFSIAVNSGSGQSATVNTAFASPLVAIVKDSGGVALQGASVTFTASGMGASGSFTGSATVVTNSLGLATAPTFTANTLSGSYVVLAATAGVSPSASFSMTNNPGAPSKYLVTAPGSAIAGVPVSVSVTAQDAFNNVATGYSGTVHFTSSDAAAILPANSTLTSGTGTFSVNFSTGGNQTVTATDTVSSGITGTSGIVVVSPRADLAVTLTDSPDPVNALGNLTYTVTLTNNGPSASVSPSVSLPLPAFTTFVSATGTAGWTPSNPGVGNNGTVSFSAASLASAGTASFTVIAKVDLNVVNNSTLTATATASETTTDPSSFNDSATATTTARSGADRVATLTASPEPVIAGTELTYTLQLQNNGPLDAENAALSFPLPAGTTFVSLGGNSGWSATTPAVGDSGTVSITNSLFAPGTVSFPLVVKVGSNVLTGSVLSATLTSTSTTIDVAPGNESASTNSNVITRSDLALDLTGTPTTAPKGSDVVFTIALTNNGPSDAVNPSVSFPIPAQMTFATVASPSGWTVSTPAIGAGGTVTFTRSGLVNGAVATFTVAAKVKTTAPNGTVIEASATASATGTDLVSANNSDSTAAAVGTTAPTALQLGTTAAFNRINGLFELTVNVTNTTPLSINGFRLHVNFASYLAAYPSLRLYNASSAFGSSDVYVDYPYPVAVDATIPVKLSFYTTDRRFPSPFAPILTVETLATSAISGPAGAGVQPRLVRLTNGNFMLEFDSVPGRWYRVRYSDDLTHWFDSPVPIQAANNRMQWIDSGAPFTSSPSSSVPSRYYLVNEIPVVPAH